MCHLIFLDGSSRECKLSLDCTFYYSDCTHYVLTKEWGEDNNRIKPTMAHFCRNGSFYISKWAAR